MKSASDRARIATKAKKRVKRKSKRVSTVSSRAMSVLSSCGRSPQVSHLAGVSVFAFPATKVYRQFPLLRSSAAFVPEAGGPGLIPYIIKLRVPPVARNWGPGREALRCPNAPGWRVAHPRSADKLGGFHESSVSNSGFGQAGSVTRRPQHRPSLIQEPVNIRLAEGRQFSDISASSFLTPQGFSPAVLRVKNASRTLAVALISH